MTITEQAPTRVELVEALAHLVATSRRMPAHWTDRKAAVHVHINELLDELEAMP